MSNEKKIELTASNGFQSPSRAPAVPNDRRPVADRLSMRAKRLEIVSDGTLAGTLLLVDGVEVGGLVRLEFLAQTGKSRIAAVATMKYDHEIIPDAGDLAGKEVMSGERPATVTVDVFPT